MIKKILVPAIAAFIFPMVLAASYPSASINSEDSNYGAELVQNGDFEHQSTDSTENISAATYAWEMPDKDRGSFGVSTMNAIHPDNTHYLTAKAKVAGYRIINTGFDGIPVKSADTYKFSMRARAKTPVGVMVSIITPDGTTLASDRIVVGPGAWTEYKTTLRPFADCSDGRLQLAIDAPSTVNFDLVSLTVKPQ